MPVSETRLKISLIDSATGELRSITNQYQQFTNTIAQGTNATKSFSNSVGGMNNNINMQNNGLEKMDALMQRVVYSAARYLLIYKGFAAIGNVWDTLIGGAYNYSKMVETNKIGMSGILMSTMELNGAQLKWNDAMGISTHIMKQLQQQSLTTTATAEELIDTFRAMLGPGIGAGMNIDQITKLTTVGVSAVKSLGLPQNQLIQELRSIVTGAIRPASSTLATSLGITNADIKKAKASSEGLFNFLIERLQGFEMAVGKSGQTIEGRTNRIKNALSQGIAAGGENLYNLYGNVLGKIADKLILVETVTDSTGKKLTQVKLNPEIEKTANAVSIRVEKLYQDLSDIGRFIMPAVKAGFKEVRDAIDFALRNIKEIVAAIALWKVGSIALDMYAVATATDSTYKAQTKLGRIMQGVGNVISGQNADMKLLAESTQELNNITQGYTNTLLQQENISTRYSQNTVAIGTLAEKYTQMGMAAEEANAIQNSIINTINTKGANAALTIATIADNYARMVQYDTLVNQNLATAGNNMLAAPRNVRGDIATQANAYRNVSGGARTEESVTRLADRYKEVGMAAEEAGVIQQRIQNLIIAGNTKQAEQELEMHNRIIRTMELRQTQETSENARFNSSIANINAVYMAQEKLNKAQTYVNNVMKKSVIATGTAEYAQAIQNTIDKLNEMGLSQEKVYRYAKIQAQALAKGHYESIDAIGQEIIKHAELEQAIAKTSYSAEVLANRTKDYTSIDYSSLTAQQEQILAFDSETILGLSTKAQMVENIRLAYENMNNAVAQGMLTEEQGHQLTIELQKQVATGYVDIANSMAMQINQEYQQGTLSQANATEKIASLQAEEAERQRILSMSAEEMTAQQKQQLLFDAENTARMNGNTKLIALLEEVTNRVNAITAAMKQRGMASTEVETAHIRLLQQVVTSGGAVSTSIAEQTNAVLTNTEKQLQNQQAITSGLRGMTKLGMGVGIAATMYSQLTGEQASWLTSAGQLMFQIPMLIDVFGSLVTRLEAVKTASIAAKAGMAGLALMAGYAAIKVGIALGKKADSWLKDNTSLDRMENPSMQVDAMYGNNTYFDAENAEVKKENELSNMTEYEKSAREQTKGMESMNKEFDNMKAMNDKINNLNAKFPTTETDSGAKSAQKKADAAEKKYQEELKKLADLREKSGTMITDVAASLEGDIYGANGCTAYVADVLKKTGVAFGQVMSMDVGIAKQQAEAAGLYHEGTEGMKQGDVVVYGSNQYPTGSHVGIYDGVNGVYHNASSQGNTAYHQQGSIDMGADTWVKGYIQTSGSSTDTAALKEAEKKYKELNGVVKALISLNKGLDEKIASLTLSPAEAKNVKLKNQVADYQSTIEKAKKLNIDTSVEVTKLLEYQLLERKKNNRENLISQHQDDMSMLDSRYKAHEVTADQLRQLQTTELNVYINNLQTQLADETLKQEDRLKLHQEYSQAIQALETTSAQTVEGAWNNMLLSMRNYTIDYQSSMTSVMSSIEGSFTGLMDGVVNGQNSFADNVKSSWDSLAQSVISSIWKMAMQMMVVKPLFNWLGGIMGGSSVIHYSGGGLSLTGGMESYNYVGNDVISTSAMASGGIGTAGWHLVGEKGPELVNFTNPGRVYTASQTANALSGNNGNGLKNVNVNIHNESGSDVKAETATTTFDANGAVIDIVIKAMANNTKGINSMVKNLARS